DNARLNYEQTLAQLNNNRANINLSKTGLAKIKYDISKTTIYAPMSGTVTQLNNEVGEKVLGTSFNQGTGIMTISDLSSMECQIDVGETDVALINIGDTARIQVDAFPNRVFTGYVYEIANTAKSKGTGNRARPPRPHCDEACIQGAWNGTGGKTRARKSRQRKNQGFSPQLLVASGRQTRSGRKTVFERVMEKL
ncbi:MAG TPA: efflux RND transporter periplasmic adaptor subunit, partial [Leptospiraceae bacterium]|nr:efflux RND transporter periplasmic adaptor subunit [Leptospiraceae bacterium]